MADHWPLVEKGPSLLTKLVARAEQHQHNPGAVADLISTARLLRRGISHAKDDLEEYSATPLDAPTQCRCGATDEHCLPIELERQTWELPPLEQL